MLQVFLQANVDKIGKIIDSENKIYFTGGEKDGKTYRRLKIAED